MNPTSIPVSLVVDEAIDVLLYMTERITECHALESRALAHTDFWIARSMARLDSLYFILYCANCAQAWPLKEYKTALYREWLQVRRDTGAKITTW